MSDLTPNQVIGEYVNAARDAMKDLTNNPAPCGHDECTGKDREVVESCNAIAAQVLTDCEALEIDPLDAAKVLSLLDVSFIFPTIERAQDSLLPASIPAWDLHYLLLASATALYDQSQLVEAQPEEVKA
jgi:hypothetical protein